MRISCEVVVQNWSCASQGSGGLRKPAKASISVGRKPCEAKSQNASSQNATFLLVCTAKNKDGVKYKISMNISQMFVKFLEKGKATIRFKEPPHDVCISKADPPKLRTLFSTIKMSSKDLQKVKLPTLIPAKTSEVQAPKLSLVILQRQDYPSSTSFPTTLTRLKISHCGMVRIDPRILTLKSLVELDLSNNKIKSLDISLERLQNLQVLGLADNKIIHLPSKLCRLLTKLISLDLSGNELSFLPFTLGRIQTLMNLKLDCNKLRVLPSNIGCLFRLCNLTLSETQLTILPQSITMLKLDVLDVFKTPLDPDMNLEVIPKSLTLPSLQEHAGNILKSSRMCYDHSIVGQHLCDFLDSGKRCYHCHMFRFQQAIITSVQYKDLSKIAHTISSTCGMRHFPVQIYFCSMNCYSQWKESK